MIESQTANAAASERFYRLLLRTVSDGTLRKLTFSLPARDSGLPTRVTGRLCKVRGSAHLSCEEVLEKGKVHHLHILPDDPDGMLRRYTEGYGRIFLSASAGDAELMRSAKGKVTLRGAGMLEKARPLGMTETFSHRPTDRSNAFSTARRLFCKNSASVTHAAGYMTRSSRNSGRSTAFSNCLRI